MSDPIVSQVSEFWNWFQDNADSIAVDIKERTRFDGLDQKLGELDQRVLNLASGISWEVGPGIHKSWQFVISPNLDRNLREVARTIVAEAPALSDWEFYSARQKKDWDYRVEVANEKEGGSYSIDAKRWRFVLLQYPDGIREILIEAAGLPKISDDDRRLIGEIVLESLLGEEVFLDSVDDFELVDEFEARFAAEARPIQNLQLVLTGGKQ